MKLEIITFAIIDYDLKRHVIIQTFYSANDEFNRFSVVINSSFITDYVLSILIILLFIIHGQKFMLIFNIVGVTLNNEFSITRNTFLNDLRSFKKIFGIRIHNNLE